MTIRLLICLLGMAALSLSARAQIVTQSVVQNTAYGPGQSVTVEGPTTVQTSGNVTVSGGANVTFLANASITLNAGFSCSGATFQAMAASSFTPTVTNQPTGGTVAHGGSTTLSASANGPGPFSYQWYHNGVAIAGANASTYTLANARVIDSGNYTVAVTGPGGTTMSSAANISVPLATPSTGAIAAGEYFSLALKSDGTVWAWGANYNGQLGIGTTVSEQDTPMQTSGLSGIVAVAAGASHGLALKNDGTVWAWGNNSYGQLGDGTTKQRLAPVQVEGLSSIIAIGAGQDHSLAVRSDGTVWAWGYNCSGQIGDNTTTNRLVPVQVSNLIGAVAVAGGGTHSLALRNDGTVWAWGENDWGQIGDGSTAPERKTPVQVIGLNGIVAVAAGAIHSMALNSAGTVWTWGDNDYAQLGSGTVGGQQNTPVQVNGVSGVVSIGTSANSWGSLVLKSDGTVWSWGELWNTSVNENGTPANLNAQLGTPTQVSGISNSVAIAAGYDHDLALKNDGTVWAWGGNEYGQFGAGPTAYCTTPVQVNGLSNVASMATGDTFCLAADDEQHVWAWGQNYYGQLGDGTTTAQMAPAQVNGLNEVIAVAAGGGQSLALDGQGHVWAWGYNLFGELGDGTTTNRSTPEELNGLNGVVAITAGPNHSLALKSDGTVWIFGTTYYQDGTSATWTMPTEVSGLSRIKAIAAGANFSLALDSNGNVWAWGYNADGELGDPTCEDHLTPWQVTSLSGVVAISTQGFESEALTSDGRILEWGDQYGSNWGLSSTEPWPILSGFAGATAIVTGPESNLILNGGTVLAWGSNEQGELGDGTTTPRTTPEPVSGLGSIKAIASGDGNFAVMSDGTVMGWGVNNLFNITQPSMMQAAIRLIPWADDVAQNGMSDAWEQKYLGTTNANPLSDPGLVGRTLLASSNEGLSPWPAPVFTPAPGTYLGAQTVTIGESIAGLTIYYTTNGTTPTTASTPYSGPITISSSATLQAIAISSGGGPSPVTSGTYTITFPTLPYLTDFEASEGYILGSLNQQLGWSVSQGLAYVNFTDAYSGSQSVALEPSTPSTLITQNFAPQTGEDIIFFDFFAKPVAEATPATTFNVGNAHFAFVLSGGQGNLQVFDGDGFGGGLWIPTSFSAPLGANNQSQNWIRFTARLDFYYETWDLYANGNMVAADLNLSDITGTALTFFSMQGDAATASEIDDIYAGPQNPLFTDSANDGIADTWKAEYGLSLTTNDRYLDPNDSSFTVLQDYINGFNPNQPVPPPNPSAVGFMLFSPTR